MLEWKCKEKHICADLLFASHSLCTPLIHKAIVTPRQINSSLVGVLLLEETTDIHHGRDVVYSTRLIQTYVFFCGSLWCPLFLMSCKVFRDCDQRNCLLIGATNMKTLNSCTALCCGKWIKC